MYRDFTDLRKRLWIYPRFQLFFITLMACINVMGIIFTGLVIKFLSSRIHEKVLTLSENQLIEVRNQFDMITGFYITGSCVLFVISIVLTLYASHRIVGPIYHLKLHIEKVNSGTLLEDLKFRRKDFFVDLIIPFNNLLAKYRKLLIGQYQNTPK